MHTTLRAPMMATPQQSVVPERYQEYFWIPTLVRRTPEPAPPASPLSDAITRAIGPTSMYATTCVAPANGAHDQSVVDAGAGVNDASVFPAEGEASGEWEAATEGEAEHEARCEGEREPDRQEDSGAQPEAELPASCAVEPAAAADVHEMLAESGAEQPRSSPSHRRGRRAAILTAFTLAAAAAVVLTVPGLAGRLVSTIGSESGPSARPFAGANDVAREPPRAGVRPLIALPVTRSLPRVAAPESVVQESLPEASTVAVAAAAIEVVAVDAAVPTTLVTPPETPLADDTVPTDMADVTGPIVPAVAGADDSGSATAIEVAPAVEAGPEAPTRARPQRSRPPRARAQRPRIGDGGDAIGGAPVIPTSRDLEDVPVEVPGAVPVEVPEEPPADEPASGS